MAEQTISRSDRTADSQAALPFVVAAGVYLVLLALAPRLLADPDSYSHIALGRWIIEHHTVPAADPFSQTMRGEHWVAFEWLSEVAYAGAQFIAGWLGVVALACAATALAFGLLTRFLLREWPVTPTLIAVLTAFVLTAPHILARPHILALPILVAWIAGLIRAADEKRAPSWLLIPLMIVWANLHGSFTFGLAMVGAIACDALWHAPRAQRAAVVKQWALFGFAALAAACVNPFGPEIILVTFRTIALGHALSTITEWRSQDFAHLGPFELTLLAGFGAALYRGIKLPPLRIVMVLGVLHLSLSQVRHADLLGLLAPIFLARPLARQFGASVKHAAVETRVAWMPALAGGLMTAATLFAAMRGDIAPAANITPVKALQAFDAAKSGPILNNYDFGGYLDYVGIAPFIDGRGELYGPAFVSRYDKALKLENVGDFLAMLDQYKFGATLLTPSTPAVGLLDRLPEWRRVYADDVAVVHVKRK